MGHFCPPGSGSGSAIKMRIRIQQLKLMRIRIRIRNPAWDRRCKSFSIFKNLQKHYKSFLYFSTWLVYDLQIGCKKGTASPNTFSPPPISGWRSHTSLGLRNLQTMSKMMVLFRHSGLTPTWCCLAFKQVYRSRLSVHISWLWHKSSHW